VLYVNPCRFQIIQDREEKARIGREHNISAYQGGHAGWVKENIVSKQWPIS